MFRQTNCTEQPNSFRHNLRQYLRKAIVVSRKLAMVMGMMLPCCLIFSQAYVSSDTPPSCYEIEGRIRNGYVGYESVITTPSTPPLSWPGGAKWQLNPSGLPIWNSHGNQYGDRHTFLFTYEPETATAIWSIDFNRDGDYSDYKESVTNTTPSIAGRGFQYISLFGQGNDEGKTATLHELSINGKAFGPYSSPTNTPFSVLFEDSTGLFNHIEITGSFSFSGHGSTERPRIWVRLGESNVAPICNLIKPIDQQSFFLGETILVEASAIDLGRIEVIEFFVDDVKVGEDESKPYEYSWQGAAEGFYTLRAKAIDNHGANGISQPVHIEIKPTRGVRLVVPRNGEIYFDPDTVSMFAEPIIPTEPPVMVEFFCNDLSIGKDSTLPFMNQQLLNPAMGIYTVKAVSTDLLGINAHTPLTTFTVRCIREDLDINGVVNTFDFLLFLADFGDVCTGCPPDFDDDGQVATFDFLRLLTRLGHVCN